MSVNTSNQEVVPVLCLDEKAMERLLVGVADYNIQNAHASQSTSQSQGTTLLSLSSTPSGEAVTSGNTGGSELLCVYTAVLRGYPR